MFVKPAPNPELPGTLFKVRMPRTFTLLPDEGREVPEDGFWLQRLSQGDVVLAEAPPETPPPEPLSAETPLDAAPAPQKSE